MVTQTETVARSGLRIQYTLTSLNVALQMVFLIGLLLRDQYCFMERHGCMLAGQPEAGETVAALCSQLVLNWRWQHSCHVFKYDSFAFQSQEIQNGTEGFRI